MVPLPPIPEILADREDWTTPSPEWEKWARETFIEGNGPLVNPIHVPLRVARIGFLLTNAVKERGGVRWHGSAGAYKAAGDGWTSAQANQRMMEWFGLVPDFLVTLDVAFLIGDPRKVCALIDHELTHCAHKIGPDGPMYDQYDRPVWTTRPHYAELVDDELSRWGAALDGRSQIVGELAVPPKITDAMLTTDG